MAINRKNFHTQIVGVAEVAEIVGVSPKTIASYLSRDQMIAPAAKLASGPVWIRDDIVKWNDNRPSRRAA